MIGRRHAAGGLRVEAGRFARAQVATVIATALEWALVAVLLLARSHYLIAAAAGALMGAGIDFSIKKWWAFAARGGILFSQGVRYAAVSAASAALNCLAAYGLVDGLRMPALPGVILASIVVGVAWNYPLHRLFVFGGTMEAVR